MGTTVADHLCEKKWVSHARIPIPSSGCEWPSDLAGFCALLIHRNELVIVGSQEVNYLLFLASCAAPETAASTSSLRSSLGVIKYNSKCHTLVATVLIDLMLRP